MNETVGNIAAGTLCSGCGAWLMPGFAHTCQWINPVPQTAPLNPWPPQPAYYPSPDYGLTGRIALLEARMVALEALVAELTKPRGEP